ncbi:AEX-3 domain-containing protein [Lipomyces starkeyi]
MPGGVAGTPTTATQIDGIRVGGALKPRAPPLPVADFFFIAGADQTALSMFINSANEVNDQKANITTPNSRGNGLQSTLQNVILDEHENGTSENIATTEPTQDQVSQTSDNDITWTRNEENITQNQGYHKTDETLKIVTHISTMTKCAPTAFSIPESPRDDMIDRAGRSLNASGLMNVTSKPENAIEGKASPNNDTEQPIASSAQHTPKPISSAHSPPFQRSTMLRRVSTSKLRQSPTIGKETFGHARRISNYDSVIPHPEPVDWCPDRYPLARKIDAALLDIFPRDEAQTRGGLPDYVPMFAFPDDIQIQVSDERPQSSWHEFVLTNQKGEKRYGTCLTVWIPVPESVAEAIEKSSEHWRLNNMSELDREFASSLSSRLVHERTKLSQLLTALSVIDEAGDADERIDINNNITMSDERINMLVDLLRPIRLGANINSETHCSAMWIPRVYGLLSRDVYSGSFRLEWLKALLHGEIVSGRREPGWLQNRVPMEYAVSQLLAEPLMITEGFQVRVDIGGTVLYARRHAANEIPGSRDTDLYPLFRCLSIMSIIELLEAVLAEARIIFVSSDLAMLTSAAAAITALIFPFKWQSVYIPVLPARLVSCLEMPVPYIIGLHRTESKLLLPQDDYVLCDLDGDAILSTSTPPLLPTAVRNKLQALLSLSAPLHSRRYNVAHGTPRYVSETFPDEAHVLRDADFMLEVPTPQRFDNLVGERSSAYRSADPDSLLQQPILNVQNFGTRTKLSVDPQRKTSEFQSFESFGAHSPRTRSTNTGSALNVGKAGIQSLKSSFRSRRASAIFPGQNMTGRGSTENEYAGNSLLSPLRETPNVGITVSAPSPIHTDEPTVAPPDQEQSSEFQTMEGHILRLILSPDTRCSVCLDGPLASNILVCESCHLQVHTTCLSTVVLPCAPTSFHASRVRAAFIRSMATLLYNYRWFLDRVHNKTSEVAKLYRFRKQDFLTSLPKEQMPYTRFLLSTQAGTEFVHELESYKDEDSALHVFDAIVEARRKRGLRSKMRPGPGARGEQYNTHVVLLSDRATWRTVDIPMRGSSEGYVAAVNRHVRTSPSGRWPPNLDTDVLRMCGALCSA